MTRYIPGGRGLKYDADGRVVQSESIDERVGRIPSTDGWVLTNLPVTTAAVACVANRIILSPVDLTDREYLLYQARISVGTAVAGQTARVAIYYYEGRLIGWNKVPNSEASLSCAAVGQVSVDLDGIANISKGKRYFIATNVSHAGVALYGYSATNGMATSPSYYDYAITSMPQTIAIDDVTKSSTSTIPMVAYLSREASEVM